ncbi:hypothetical protein D3C87_859980 [compost metagenome]
MCFYLRYEVDHVENPDVVQTFSGPQAAMVATAQLFMDNQVVQAVLDEVAKFDNVKEITYGDPIGELPDRTVIVTNWMGQRYLQLEGTVHPEQMYVSAHMGLDGKIFSLQLKDFGYVVMYSLTATAEGSELRIKFGVESESVTAYNCKK